ncbi:MAG: serine/threonine-protein kinase [Acidobacteriota bacterium]
MTQSAPRDTDRELRILQLVGEALDLEGDARRRFIDEACREDPSYREDLAELLEEEEDPKQVDFLERPPVPGLAGTITSVLDELTPYEPMPAPDQLGPYRIIQKLGQGGMGSVYLGEQREPIRRQVALKIIDKIDHPKRRKRFKAECQALARLGHPNVAGLYEVGTTVDGHPFVALEWIDGIDINIWCDERGASIRQRIELFFDICSGIRHAHEKGILHRDLKPSNVLVTEVDGRPMAKVIDFGIARGFDKPLLADTPQLTMENQLIGSPAYMSPEAAFGKRDIDTRSDIYSLGLLLYELLVGTLPLDIEKETLTTLLRRMASEIRPAPSDRFLELPEEEQEQIAAERGLDVRGLLRRIRGDLDAIVLKAIARERDQRYGTPAEMAADLRRYLRHEPIEARPFSVPYVAGRFLRRHYRSVVSITLLVAILTTGLVARTLEARRANMEAERANLEAQRARMALVEAQEVSNFLAELFQLADPDQAGDGPADVRELLELGAERLQSDLTDHPLARARLLQTIGNIYTNMAQLDEAEALIEQSRAIREAELGPDDPLLLENANQLGIIYRRQGKLDEAEALLRKVLTARENAPTPDPLAVANALNNLGNLLWSRDQFSEAEELQRRALELRERHLEPNHLDISLTLNNLGVMAQEQKRWEDAQPMLLRAAEIVAVSLGKESHRYAAALYTLSSVEAALGLWDAAEMHSREALKIWQETHGPIHPQTLNARTRYGFYLQRLGKFAESEKVFAETLRDLEAGGQPADAPKAIRSRRSLALSQVELGKFEDADRYLRQNLELLRAAPEPDLRRILDLEEYLGWLQWRWGRLAEAEATLLGALEKRGGAERETALVAWVLRHLAAVYVDQGRLDEADSLARRALAVSEATLAPTHRYLGDALHLVSEISVLRGELDGVRELAQRALELRIRGYGPRHPARRATRDLLAKIDAGL